MTKLPAICGGEPAFPNGPPDWPQADPDVLAALEAAYRDGAWGRYHGPHLTALCERMTATLGVEHVWPCCSGTIAVELALRGLGLGLGDEVVLGGYDFPGNFRAIEAVGAMPVLVDLEPNTRCLDVDQFAAAVTSQTKAVIATHLHGGLVDMPRLREAADARGVKIVEDACQSPGAIIAGRQAGTWGDVGTYSFGGSKLLTAGRGGAVVTQSADILQRLKVYCERGNHAFPLSELQAAVLPAQWDKLPERNARRLAAAKKIAAMLGGVSGLATTVVSDPSWEPAYYKFGILFDGEQLGGYSREQFVAAARAEGIALDAGFRGFVRRGVGRCRRMGELPIATAAAHGTLLLHHPVLLGTDDTAGRLAESLSRLAEEFRNGAIEFNVASNAGESES